MRPRGSLDGRIRCCAEDSGILQRPHRPSFHVGNARSSEIIRSDGCRSSTRGKSTGQRERNLGLIGSGHARVSPSGQGALFGQVDQPSIPGCRPAAPSAPLPDSHPPHDRQSDPDSGLRRDEHRSGPRPETAVPATRATPRNSSHARTASSSLRPGDARPGRPAAPPKRPKRTRQPQNPQPRARHPRRDQRKQPSVNAAASGLPPGSRARQRLAAAARHDFIHIPMSAVRRITPRQMKP